MFFFSPLFRTPEVLLEDKARVVEEQMLSLKPFMPTLLPSPLTLHPEAKRLDPYS